MLHEVSIAADVKETSHVKAVVGFKWCLFVFMFVRSCADLETVPPGFREGMKFDGDQAVAVSKSNVLHCNATLPALPLVINTYLLFLSYAVSIQELLAGYTSVEWSQLNEKEGDEISHSPEVRSIND